MSTHTTPATSPLASLDNPERAELRPCACQFVTVDGETSGCTRTTKRTFAPGHDAQLKSRLIKALVSGAVVGNVEQGATSAAEEAGRHGFGYQVSAGYARAQREQQAKAERKAALEAVREANRATREAARADAQAKREAARAAKAADRKPVIKAKVGRWEVLGSVVKGDLHYTTKKGVAKVAKSGSYTLV